MASLRSGITQATRGGRWVVSRRNFCSSTFGKETKVAAERVGEGGRISSANGISIKGVSLSWLGVFGCLSTGIVLAHLTVGRAFRALAEASEELEQGKAEKLAIAPSGSED